MGVISSGAGPQPSPLPWPPEPADDHPAVTRFDAPPANLLLDLHGSLQEPGLVLFFAGNLFRTVPDLLVAFRRSPPARAAGVERVFYATLPPGRMLDAMHGGGLAIGNYLVDLNPGRLWPDAFMAGAREHQRLAELTPIDPPQRIARNRGMVLLVRAGNPLGITGVADLVRDDVRVAISSREREAASFASYAATLLAQGGAGLVERVLAKASTVHPAYVHHREVPQLIADSLADVAPLYRHLAHYLAERFPDRLAFVPLPVAGNHADVIEIALLKGSARALAAQLWRDFLRGPEAGAILAQHGFDPL